MFANRAAASPTDAIAAGPPDVAASAGRNGAAAPPVAAPRKRWRRWRIVLGCLLVLALIPVAGYFVVTWMSERDVEAVIAEIEAADPRWRFEDILADRSTPAEADNPALVVGKVEVLMRGAGGWDFAVKGPDLFDALPAVNRLNDLQLGEVRRALGKHPEAIQMARTLRDFSGEGRYALTWGPDYLTTNLEPLQRCRNAMGLLHTDAMLRAEEDDVAGAVESSRGLLVTARSIGQEPSLIAALIRYAGDQIAVAALERSLAQGEPPDSELKAMQDLLADEIGRPVLYSVFRGERAGMDQVVIGLKTGKVKVSALMGASRTPGNTWEAWFLDHVPIVLTSGRAEYLRLMNECVDAAKKPAEEQRDEFTQVEQKARNSRALAVRLLLPACTKISEANRRIQANLRCALVAVAAERYRIRHDRWPTKLDQLVTDGLLRALPLDPYDGQPLRYRQRPDGAVVYSVGNDRVDNDGNINRTRPLDAGVDQGFELWNVGVRRQPPLPSPNAGGAP